MSGDEQIYAQAYRRLVESGDWDRFVHSLASAGLAVTKVPFAAFAG
jgi:hypothetical protein